MGEMGILFLGDLRPSEIDVARLNSNGVANVIVDEGVDVDASRARILAADFVVANNIDLNQFVEELAKVRLVVLAATGYSMLSRQLFTKHRVQISNLASYSKQAVVQ